MRAPATSVPAPTTGASDAQKKAYEDLLKNHACRICGEAHPFTCPYIREAVLRGGELVKVSLRDEFYADYIGQIPHGPEDIEV